MVYKVNYALEKLIHFFFYNLCLIEGSNVLTLFKKAFIDIKTADVFHHW